MVLPNTPPITTQGTTRINEKDRTTRTTTGPPSPGPSNATSSVSTSSPSEFTVPFKFHLPKSLEWMPRNWTWSNIKPAIRCAIVAWVSSLLFIIPKVEVLMGQAGFLVLVAAFLSPPRDPFIAVLERECLILLFVAVAWAWVCLGVFLANLARTNTDLAVSFTQATSGAYIQAAPTVITAAFLFLGSAFFLYLKARLGPGPYLFPTIFACICIDIGLTTAVLFPYPYYLIGQSIAIPICFHSALALLGALLIFPSTISAQYTTRLQMMLTPFISALDMHREMLTLPIPSEEFQALASKISSTTDAAEGALAPLSASLRLLGSDIIWCRFAPGDFSVFQQLGRRLAGRANGMSLYLILADFSSNRFPITPIASHANTPGPSSPLVSRPHSPERGESASKIQLQKDDTGMENLVGTESPLIEGLAPEGKKAPRSIRGRKPVLSLSTSQQTSLEMFRTGGSQPSSPVASSVPHHHHHHRHHHHGQLHHALLHLSLGRKKENAVGVFESQRYLNLETKRLNDPYADVHTQRMTRLLEECCTDLLVVTREGLIGVKEWLDSPRAARFRSLVGIGTTETQKQNKLDAIQRLRYRVASALKDFKNDKRLRVLDPYRPAFEESEGDQEFISPPHHYLFHCYVYQYHLMQFSRVVINMLDEVIGLEVKRDRARLWTPVKKFLPWNKYDLSEQAEKDEDDDPDVIQGVQPSTLEDLGVPRQRDPDALPPRNAFEWIMSILYYAAAGLAQGNALFAIKAGLFTVALCLPYFIQHSAEFAYKNRFVWAIIMGQLTLARFRGDTTFGLTTRIFSTFAGGVVGMAIWYVSRGDTVHGPYGLSAVFAFCFPFFFYANLYWPGPPMTNIMFFVTIALVVGYSYQATHIPIPASTGSGFSVAWRRFVLVTVGVTLAFIVSFLPPSTTLRRYQRRLLSTTCNELGSIYCAIISFANLRRESEVQDILTSLIAIRSKLKRSAVLRTNVIYELSLRGRWPAQRYQNIMDLQLQIAYSLSHLMSVIEHLEPAWTRALLKRTRFVDPNFQGDTLAVITMIASSLRTGEPLPQITPAPLIDRFMLKYHGLDVIHKESEEDYGLPRSLTVETLQNEQYLMFCVGVSTAFNIVNRLDRLMVAAKDIVGEQYHIHGIGLAHTKGDGDEPGLRSSTVQFRPPKDV